MVQNPAYMIGQTFTFKFNLPKSAIISKVLLSRWLLYKCFTIVIYDRNDSGQYYKTTIMIVIDDPS